jgi:serine/threonine-protein kinase
VSITTGTKLGQYEVQDFIGQGAMGLVFRAYHSQLERTGAVKVLQAISPDRDTTARFRHEAQAIAQLRHPNIVNVYDFGEYEGTPYMIVEFVPGGSLADRLGSGQLEPTQALKYLRGIAAGLDYAHGMGVVHRDVKPANVLLAKDNTPVLADFGLAKLMQGSSIKSMSGVTTGTPAYMAPEQVTGSAVGPAADRYSLATIAYEMFARVIPFDGQGLMELLYAHVHRDPLPPSAHNSALSRRADEVILRGLAKEPAARWESCTAFVDALAAALGEKAEPVAAGAMALAASSAATLALNTAAATAVAVRPGADAINPNATVAIPWPAPAPPAAKRRSRKRPIAAIGAATLVVLLILGAIWSAAQPPTPTISLSATNVRAGDSVVVTATHVPANQEGTIQLLSATYDFHFRSDASGNVSTDITIPQDIDPGDHIVRICWASKCHASTSLRVVQAEAVATPSPDVTPGASPQPTSTPGQPPTPSAGPAPRPGTTPTPTPRATPIPTPIPTPSPTPTPAPYVTVAAISQLNGFTAVLHYFGGGTWSISVFDVTQGRSFPAGTATVPSGSTYFAQKFNTPLGVLASNQAYVMACNGSGTCHRSNTVTVGP